MRLSGKAVSPANVAIPVGFCPFCVLPVLKGFTPEQLQFLAWPNLGNRWIHWKWAEHMSVWPLRGCIRGTAPTCRTFGGSVSSPQQLLTLYNLAVGPVGSLDFRNFPILTGFSSWFLEAKCFSWHGDGYITPHLFRGLTSFLLPLLQRLLRPGEGNIHVWLFSFTYDWVLDHTTTAAVSCLEFNQLSL